MSQMGVEEEEDIPERRDRRSKSRRNRGEKGAREE